jgi:hypothetical protein
MTQLAMFGDALGEFGSGHGGADAGLRRGKTEGCLSEKISILISADGSTAGRVRSLSDTAALILSS